MIYILANLLKNLRDRTRKNYLSRIKINRLIKYKLIVNKF
jgi:hypothetical protein